MLFKLAWRNIWRNKMRTSITMIGVLLAVVLSTLMMSFKEGIYSNMIKSMVSDFTGFAQIHDTSYVNNQLLENSIVLSDSLTQYLENHPDLKGYTPRLSYGALAYKDNRDQPATLSKMAFVYGVDFEKEKESIQLNERVVEGNYFTSDQDGLLIGSGLAKRLKVTVNDSIILSSSGYQDVPSYGLYKVHGVVKFGSPELSNNLIILPLSEAQYMFNMEKRCTDIILRLKDNERATEIVADINKSLGGIYLARDWEELNEDLLKLIATDKVEGYIFMFILYMVISFGLFGTMLMMLSERMREFGVLISIGMKRMKLSMVVWWELISISFLGAILGMALAFPVCAYFYYNPVRLGSEYSEMMEDYGMEAVIQSSLDPSIFLQQGIIVFIISAIIAMYPVVKLNRLNTQTAMRS